MHGWALVGTVLLLGSCRAPVHGNAARAHAPHHDKKLDWQLACRGSPNACDSSSKKSTDSNVCIPRKLASPSTIAYTMLNRRTCSRIYKQLGENKTVGSKLLGAQAAHSTELSEKAVVVSRLQGDEAAMSTPAQTYADGCSALPIC